METIVRTTESQLEREIDSLDGMLDRAEEGAAPTSRWAQSYLRQLRRDRQHKLSLLRYRTENGNSAMTLSEAPRKYKER